MFYSWFLDVLVWIDRLHDIIYMKSCWGITNNNSSYCSFSHYCCLLSVAINTCIYSYSLSQTIKQNISKICRCFVILSAPSMMQVCNQEQAQLFHKLLCFMMKWKWNHQKRMSTNICNGSFYLHVFQLCQHMIKCKYHSAFSVSSSCKNYIHKFSILKMKMSLCSFRS